MLLLRESLPVFVYKNEEEVGEVEAVEEGSIPFLFYVLYWDSKKSSTPKFFLEVRFSKQRENSLSKYVINNTSFKKWEHENESMKMKELSVYSFLYCMYVLNCKEESLRSTTVIFYSIFEISDFWNLK